MINFKNYYNSTEAVFKGCKKPKRKPDYQSLSNSQYWYGADKNGEYVIRYSHHWVNVKPIGSNAVTKDCKSIATCIWHIKTTKIELFMAGKAYLNSFKKI